MTDTLAPQGEGAACAPTRLYGSFFTATIPNFFGLLFGRGL